jgi:hypothetical protein
MLEDLIKLHWKGFEQPPLYLEGKQDIKKTFDNYFEFFKSPF